MRPRTSDGYAAGGLQPQNRRHRNVDNRGDTLLAIDPSSAEFSGKRTVVTGAPKAWARQSCGGLLAARLVARLADEAGATEDVARQRHGHHHLTSTKYVVNRLILPRCMDLLVGAVGSQVLGAAFSIGPTAGSESPSVAAVPRSVGVSSA